MTTSTAARKRFFRQPGTGDRSGLLGWPGSTVAAALVGAALIALGIAWVAATHTRPSYDAFGWMVWGRQVLHWKLNTDGAPSWKPLTFLFTLPFALFGRAQMSLWTVTASAAALSSVVFAARIAFRLTGAPERDDSANLVEAAAGSWPALFAGAFAGVAVLGMAGLGHQMLIATSDPMVVALCLAAVDAHLSGRPRLAFAALVLASLGRPETWLFTGLYAVWAWRAVPSMRTMLLAGLLLIPVGWFAIPGLTSKSWFSAGTLALKSPDALRSGQLSGVIDRFLGLYELPMKLAVLGALVLAAVRRERTWLLLAAAALAWVAVEVAFVYHGWPAMRRYMMEAGAVLVVLAGAGVGRVLRAFAEEGAWPSWVGTVAVLILCVTLLIVAGNRIDLLRSQVHRAQLDAERIDGLQTAVTELGGADAIKRCGHPVTMVGYQSTLAWMLGTNVGDIGYKPSREIRSGRPIILLKPHGLDWRAHPIHIRSRNRSRCREMFATLR